MKSNNEIWRRARLLVRRYGQTAPAEAALRAETMSVRGDASGRSIWMRVRGAVARLHGEPTGIQEVPAQR